VTDTLQRPAGTLDRTPEILAAAEIVMDRLGHDKLSLAQIARVSLIPLARIYQYFADRNAVLGALSSRALARLAGSVDIRGSWSTELTESQRLARVIDRFAGFVAEPTTAYLVLCGPFDAVSGETRQLAVERVALALGSALLAAESGESARHSDEELGYAADLVFACFRRSYEMDGRVSAIAIEMAQRAVRAFIAA
jgi:AcrR family transcriptional regulator